LIFSIVCSIWRSVLEVFCSGLDNSLSESLLERLIG
jgi:hypothetical protein